MKALWKGTLTVALLSIPVKLYTAVRKRPLEFHLLHRSCNTPLKYERYCPSCRREIPWEEVVRGYEYEKNKFIPLEEEELEAVFPKINRTIEILSFVRFEEVDVLYLDHPYYLAPQEGAEEAYVVLQKAMARTGKAALVRFALREKEHLGLIRPYRHILVLHTLHYAQEIIPPDFIQLPGQLHLDPRVLTMAEELVELYSASPKPEEWVDRSAQALLELIQRKISGGEVEKAPVQEARRVINLMEALEKSLARKGRRKKEERMAA